MIRIHSAFIYALISNVIKSKDIARRGVKSKKVYRYLSTDDRYETMIVSNGTDCDEFYEILDSLYISRNIVTDIEKLQSNDRMNDQIRHANFDNTTFYKNMHNFTLDNIEKGSQNKNKLSLFAIPLVYFNSLPNSLRFSDEMEAIVEAVVELLRSEITATETEDSIKYVLSDILKEQFDLFVKNCSEITDFNLSGTVLADNEIVDCIYRIVKKEITEAGADNYSDVIKDMEAKIGK
ncbi:MAG: hypothetical protein IJS94_03940, partial [Clostridia bacterium]|nr:hypothetical protein [Clostridia bacterium]